MTQPSTLRGIFSGKSVVLPDWMPVLYVAAAVALIAALGVAALFDHPTSAARTRAASPVSVAPRSSHGAEPLAVVDADGNPATLPASALAAAKAAIPVGAENVVLLVASATATDIDLRVAYDPDGPTGPAVPVLQPLTLHLDDAGNWVLPGA
ncbi:MAG TPA: hypothetical protein VHD87_12705 [Acidimicrobiales bacterium]|nr:hypothetical protein [Acidimicrobiales bacterium]